MSSYSHAQVILQIIDRERKMSTHSYSGDLYGTPNPKYNDDMPRFQILVRGYEPDDPDPDWQYKLTFIDHKYQDSDGFPVDAIAAGNCWEDAFSIAGEWMDRALNTDHCIF